jgi:guanine nucleotide-binding protein subunit alpha
MLRSKRQRISDDDPLARAMAQALQGETFLDRQKRLAAELEAKRVSDAIDEELNKQRIAEKKGPKAIKILLLGALHYTASLHTTNHTSP